MPCVLWTRRDVEQVDREQTRCPRRFAENPTSFGFPSYQLYGGLVVVSLAQLGLFDGERWFDDAISNGEVR
jgi:hypothetical protein